MDTKALAQLIGRLGKYRVNSMIFGVKVVDAKVTYGRTRLQITPMHGEGYAWVDVSSVEVLPQE